MKIFRNILIASVVLGLNAAPIAVYAMPEPVPAAQTDKQKAAEKKKKEQEKAKAQKAKEAAKAKAAKEKEKAKAAKAKEKAAESKKKEAAKKQAEQAKANEKAAAEREKAAEERAKVAEQRAKVAEQRAEEQAKKEAAEKAKEEKALRDYEKYQESLENPATEPISYFNLGLRLGYAAMMDKLNGSYMGAGTLNQSNVFQQLKGGPGAGLDVVYNLEYGHFLFEAGLDFRFLNSTSAYGFTAQRQDLTYGATYNYLFDNLNEMRNMAQIGVPLMFGAQFSRYYFLVGAKVHYTLMGSYNHKGMYDIVVNDPAMLEPYGMGIHELNGNTKQQIVFKQPEVSVAAEVGIDLDEWLQAQPDPKKSAKVKPGQRLPFGREHVHYRVALFAEYGVLNTNGTPAAKPLEYNTTSALVQNTNTLLAWNGDTKLNNLFVGAKFTIQFEIPGKKARPVPPPASYAIYSVVDAETNQPIDKAVIETRESESGKIALREKQVGVKGLRQKHTPGAFSVSAKADGYYDAMQSFDIEKVGSTEYVTVVMRPRPIFRLRVTDKETGKPLATKVEVRRTGIKEPVYTLVTDSVTGAVRQMMTEGPRYSLHIVQMGYERVDMMIANIGDTLNIALNPVKKGEVFIVQNLHFATNKTRILSRSEDALQELYQYLTRNPKVRIKIIGHTDNVGNDKANQQLSEGRAKAVMQDLIERGIAPERLQAEGRGESQPIDTNDTEEGRQNNRRVEIEIL